MHDTLRSVKSLLEVETSSDDKSASALKLLVIDAHPREGSFGQALAETFLRGAADAGCVTRPLQLRRLVFSMNELGQPLEEDLQEAQSAILWADHIVLVFPTWWGTVPALLKGFFDRVFRRGFAFARNGTRYRGLLKGRTAMLITTMDTPPFIYRWFFGAPGIRAVRDATLGFCGISTVRIIELGPIVQSSHQQRAGWLEEIQAEGRAAARIAERSSLDKIGAWARAVRVHFLPMPALAYTAGAFLGARELGHSLWFAPFFSGLAAMVSIQIATVFANELCDYPSDRRNENAGIFTGGSRVLVDRHLTRGELSGGLFLLLCCAALFTMLFMLSAPGSPAGPLLLGAAAVVCGLGYSVSPLRLAWRTLGEGTVALTHSFLVILAGVLSQGGSWLMPPAWLFATPLFLAVLPAILLAGIPDIQADRFAGKKTFAVRYGRRAAFWAASAAAVGAAACLYVMGQSFRPLLAAFPFAAIHAALLCVLFARQLRAREPASRINLELGAALSYMIWFVALPFAAL